MNAFHSANLFLFSSHHIPTNPQFLQFLWWRAIALKMSAFQLYTVANLHLFFINSVNNTKLPCYNLPLMQHHSFFWNLPRLPAQQSSTQHEQVEKKFSLFLINFSGSCHCSCIQDPVLPIFCLFDSRKQTGWVLAGFSLCYNQVS